jgi:hypothetical protein
MNPLFAGASMDIGNATNVLEAGRVSGSGPA